MSGQQFAWAVLIIALIGIAVCLVCIPVAAFVRWVNDRVDARMSAASFDATFIPESGDVAEQENALPDLREREESTYQQLVARIRQDQETLAICDEIDAVLQDMRGQVERLQKAADAAEVRRSA